MLVEKIHAFFSQIIEQKIHLFFTGYHYDFLRLVG